MSVQESTLYKKWQEFNKDEYKMRTKAHKFDIIKSKLWKPTDIMNYNLTVKDRPIKIRDYQLEAISHCLNNKQALLLSPTASGKSLIIYCIVRWFIEEFLMIVLI